MPVSSGMPPRRPGRTSPGGVSGALACDSERDISVGGVGAVPAALFDGFSYVALGHLHGQQSVDERMRYSGSPMAYSFSEAAHRKGSWLVDLDAAGTVAVEAVAAPVWRPLVTLRGTLGTLLSSAEHAAARDAFVAVTLTDPVRPVAAMERLRARFPHTLMMTWEPAGVVPDPRSYLVRVQGRTDLEIATGFVEHVRATPATTAEQELLTAAFDAVRIAAAEAGATPGSDGAAVDGPGLSAEVA